MVNYYEKTLTNTISKGGAVFSGSASDIDGVAIVFYLLSNIKLKGE